MDLALSEAHAAMAADEVPVGAVIVKDGQVLATGRNCPRELKDATAHAEIMAIRAACGKIGNDRLDGCELWVTLEPCAMCAAAISHARIARLFFGASDQKGGAVIHGPAWFDQPTCLHRPEVYWGFEEQAAEHLLKRFFAARR